ncbi:MAG: 2-octaprenyl-6-methoxyphenyl hydroxylase [Pseudomonadales bacterium]
MTTNKTEQPSDIASYDVVIIGGGMVGASLACALMPAIREFGLKVAMIESFALPEQADEVLYQPSYDDRSTAVSYGSRCLLQQLGVWKSLSLHATPIEHIHVSDKGYFGKTRLHAEEHGIEALGYVVENAWLGRVLLQEVRESAAIDCISPASVSAITTIVDSDGQSYQRLTVEGDDGIQQVNTQLAVVADGGRSQVCQQLGIQLRQSAYQQCAIIANVSAEKPHRNVAYERFTEQGPIALLPLHEEKSSRQNRSALVFTVANKDVESVLAMDDSAFLTELQSRFGYRLGRFTSIGQRESYPLNLQRSTEQVRPGIVVIGNAAHSLHPVAGQGFNLALRGLMTLAKHLQRGLAEGKGIGSLQVLQAYVAEQQADQDKTILFTDQLLKLFGNSSPMVGHVRGCGLLALDLFRPARHAFARQAMGLGDRLPRVSSGAAE